MNGSGTGSAAYHSEDEFEDFATTRPGQQYVPGTASGPPAGPGPIPMSSSIGLTPVPNTGTTLGNTTGGASSNTLVQPKAEFPSASAATTYPTPGTAQAVLSTSGHRGGGNVCCLLDDARRCQRTAGNASYSKRVQKTVFYKRLRLDVDNTVS